MLRNQIYKTAATGLSSINVIFARHVKHPPRSRPRPGDLSCELAAFVASLEVKNIPNWYIPPVALLTLDMSAETPSVSFTSDYKAWQRFCDIFFVV